MEGVEDDDLEAWHARADAIFGNQRYQGDGDMLNDFSESKVTIKKTDLLDAVRKNRDTHEKEYLAAREGYRETVIKRLEVTLEGVRAGGSFDLAEFHALASKPTSHTKDYDRVIRMMEMSTADEVTVSETQFSCYVLDEWNWKAQFALTNATYSKGGR